jgi:hypothetical protein
MPEPWALGDHGHTYAVVCFCFFCFVFASLSASLVHAQSGAISSSQSDRTLGPPVSRAGDRLFPSWGRRYSSAYLLDNQQGSNLFSERNVPSVGSITNPNTMSGGLISKQILLKMEKPDSNESIRNADFDPHFRM